MRAPFGCVVVLMLGLSPTLDAQENPLRLIFDAEPSRKATVGAFRQRGVVYVSVDDLAKVFALNTYQNRDARKLELKELPLRLTVSATNSFVVRADHSGRRAVHQISAPVVFASGSYYAPAASFVPLFNQTFNKDLSYDRREGVLRVGRGIPVSTFDITTVTFEQKSNGMLIRIPATRELKDYESWLRQDGWLYVTIADAKADIRAINRLKPSGIVRQIVAIQSPGSVQLTFKLSGKIAAADIVKPDDSNELLVTVRTPGAEDRLLLESRRREVQANIESMRKRYELDVIVIDAGHGGHDFGAIGVTGLREKDVTLGISRKLGKLIEKNLKDVKVVYTRTDDRFVELYRRGKIANEAGGKLFLSIHANSLKRKPNPTRGFEVYLLRPGRTDEAIAIAERENAVIQLEEGFEERYEQLTDENFILVTMAQSAHARASEVFADIVQQEMEKRVSVPNRGVKQAGFLVLVGASMPNILVETAYLSNRDDEKYLRSEKGQQQIAEALFHAIKRYKAEYEKYFQEGRDFGVNVGGEK